MLAAHSVAGRASSSVVHLEDPSASSIHAAVSWTGERWEARDLGSSNGTFVNEVRAVLQENTLLMRGAFLRFGGAAERWELTDECVLQMGIAPSDAAIGVLAAGRLVARTLHFGYAAR